MEVQSRSQVRIHSVCSFLSLCFLVKPKTSDAKVEPNKEDKKKNSNETAAEKEARRKERKEKKEKKDKGEKKDRKKKKEKKESTGVVV